MTPTAKACAIVTGSSRLNVFRRGGDSLMGRYLFYRMHPWTVGECLRTDLPAVEIQPPTELPAANWDALWEQGGFPEPFLRRDTRLSRRWRSLRPELLSREDLLEFTRVQDLGAMEILMQILAERSGRQVTYSNLSLEINVAVDTVKRWIDLLCRLHYGFVVGQGFPTSPRRSGRSPNGSCATGAA